MRVKYDNCSDRIKKHIVDSDILSVRDGYVILHNKYCDSETLINQLVHDKVVTIEELVELLN